MTTKITLVIDNPTDVAAFEQTSRELVAQARTLPKLQLSSPARSGRRRTRRPPQPTGR